MDTIAAAFGTRWLPVQDGDARAYALYRRHYSAKRRNDPLRRMRGPADYQLLLTPCLRAVFLWKLEQFRRDEQTGVNCAVFRNEGAGRSSDLIREACGIAWARWPGQRLYTFVNAAKLPHGKRPGYCFESAGWARCGTSKGGLLIFEHYPPTIH